MRRGTRFSFSMKHMGPSLWNELPLIIRTAEYVPQFKRNIKDCFFGGNLLNFCMAGRLSRGGRGFGEVRVF